VRQPWTANRALLLTKATGSWQRSKTVKATTTGEQPASVVKQNVCQYPYKVFMEALDDSRSADERRLYLQGVG